MSLYTEWKALIRLLNTRKDEDARELPMGFYIPRIVGIERVVRDSITFQVGIVDQLLVYYPAFTRNVTLKITDDVKDAVSRLLEGNPTDDDMRLLELKAISSLEFSANTLVGFTVGENGITYSYIGNEILVISPATGKTFKTMVGSIGLEGGKEITLGVSCMLEKEGLSGRIVVKGLDEEIVVNCQPLYGEYQNLIVSDVNLSPTTLEVWFECDGSGYVFLRNWFSILNVI